MKKYKRPSWDQYFIEAMEAISKRSTCDRGRSGCVIVKDNQILAQDMSARRWVMNTAMMPDTKCKKGLTRTVQFPITAFEQFMPNKTQFARQQKTEIQLMTELYIVE